VDYSGAAAPTIDIGCGAIDRDSFITPGWTRVFKENPANISGKITSIEIWANTEMINVEVATFYTISENNLSTRDTHTIGTVEMGTKQTFSGLSINVQAGDYIGIYWSVGNLETDNIGTEGSWYKEGDNIPCTNVTFAFQGPTYGGTPSLYGTGT